MTVTKFAPLVRSGMLAILLPSLGCATFNTPNETVSSTHSPSTDVAETTTVEDADKDRTETDAPVRTSSHQAEPTSGETPETVAPDRNPQTKAVQPGEGVREVARPQSLTLDRAINTTLIADPRIRAGFESINQANANLLTASLRPNPSLFTDAQLLPLTRPFTVDQTGGPPQADAILSYPIDWFVFGKRAANMAAANMGVRVSEAAYTDLIRRRVTETAVNFYDVLEAKALVDLAKQDVAYFEHVESITHKAVDAGSRPPVDLKRVQLDLLNSRRALRDAELVRVNAQSRLRALMGRLDGDATFDVAGDLQGKLHAEPIGSEEAYQLAVENRPDIQSDRLRISEAVANVQVEERRAYPEITPHFGLTRQFQTRALGVPDANSYEVALTTTLPFSNRNQGNRSRAVSLLAERRYELQASLVNLRSEIEQASQAFRTEYQNALSVADAQLKLATEVRDSINQAYQKGQRPLVDVLDAERNYRDTYRTYITGRASYWRALYRLNSAIGKHVVY